MDPNSLSVLSGSRRASVAWAACLFTAIALLRLALPDPNLGISFLFVAPVVLLAIAYGARGVTSGTAFSLVLMYLTAVLTGVPLGAGDYLVRGAVIALVGITASAFTEVNRRLEAETTIWFEEDLGLHCIASKDGRFLRVNDAFVKVLGYAREDLLSKPFIDFVHPDDRDKTIAETAMLAEGLGDSVDFENRYLAKDGSYHWLRWSGTPARDGKIYASARDVTTQIELQRQLEELARTDALTGLANRRSFEQEAERLLEHISRHGRGAALLMLDLDGFKAVNDRVGHQAGDQVLTDVATGLRSRLRSSDLLARIGGDEFIMLLPEVGMSEVGAIAAELLAGIRACSWSGDGAEFPISGSIGVALFDLTSGRSFAELVHQADQAMYDAKRSGGNQFCVGARYPALKRLSG